MEQEPADGDAFHFRGLLATALPASPVPSVPPAMDASANELCAQLIAEGDNIGQDCGEKPNDVPGYVWNCEPNSRGVWQWKRVRLINPAKPKAKAKAEKKTNTVHALARAYDFGTQQGRNRWRITFIAALAADLRFNQGQMLISVLNSLPIPLPAWAIRMIIGVFVRLVNASQE